MKKDVLLVTLILGALVVLLFAYLYFSKNNQKSNNNIIENVSQSQVNTTKEINTIENMENEEINTTENTENIDETNINNENNWIDAKFRKYVANEKWLNDYVKYSKNNNVAFAKLDEDLGAVICYNSNFYGEKHLSLIYLQNDYPTVFDDCLASAFSGHSLNGNKCSFIVNKKAICCYMKSNKTNYYDIYKINKDDINGLSISNNEIGVLTSYIDKDGQNKFYHQSIEISESEFNGYMDIIGRDLIEKEIEANIKSNSNIFKRVNYIEQNTTDSSAMSALEIIGNKYIEHKNSQFDSSPIMLVENNCNCKEIMKNDLKIMYYVKLCYKFKSSENNTSNTNTYFYDEFYCIFDWKYGNLEMPLSFSKAQEKLYE